MKRELITERVNAGMAAARANGTKFGRPLAGPSVIAGKLEIVQQERAKGRTAEEAAKPVGWSRATLDRHQRLSGIVRSAQVTVGSGSGPKLLRVLGLMIAGCSRVPLPMTDTAAFS